MAYVPEDRHERGLVMDFDLVQNGILGSQHSPPFAAPAESTGTTRATTRRRLSDSTFGHRTPTPTRGPSPVGPAEVRRRSGVRPGPGLVVATHPTRGVDIGAMEFIHERLFALREAGRAVLLISSNLDEVQALSDRLDVVYEGDIVDIVDPERVTEEQLGLSMAGQQPDAVPTIAANGEGHHERWWPVAERGRPADTGLGRPVVTVPPATDQAGPDLSRRADSHRCLGAIALSRRWDGYCHCRGTAGDVSVAGPHVRFHDAE